MNDNRPICAVATAPGRGGIGVVRVSGKGLDAVIHALCGRALPPRHATYLGFLADDGSDIDRGIAIHFPAPHSYTGEEVLELQGHGGPVVLQLLLRRVLQAGAAIGMRLAEPGEFTQRAYLNDKLDLAQAEAVADLIDASTEQAARSATRSLAGAFSEKVDALVTALTELRMLVEATLDFPEEEIDFLESAHARERLQQVESALATLLQTARQGTLLRDGLNVVLAGEPNVGKSSLLNALAGAEVAIVTPIAGTTRDKVTQAIQIEGVPLNIIDTAGLRDTHDEVERIGIERTWAAIADADVVVLLSNASGDDRPPALQQAVRERLPAGVTIVRVHNKIDLLDGVAPRVEERAVWLSARTGAGVDLLRALLLEVAGWQPGNESQFIARERHLAALRTAQSHLSTAATFAGLGNAHLDLFAEELRLAQVALGTITGEFTADDLLGVIFGRFCIGK
ncbi:MAG TPA: tRNA uridine-5-carboxymethylaminomethyl(34) synthesis GTPase MnmE [Burkholderiaceae bacterium]|nr:tRNA uridine-5-carboxymethylaminomethyl(34) synthesis GTPase MnmE [Burkholderiaceae bacterium]